MALALLVGTFTTTFIGLIIAVPVGLGAAVYISEFAKGMAQTRRASDKCSFILMGELVEHTRTEDLFLAPKNPKTAE